MDKGEQNEINTKGEMASNVQSKFRRKEGHFGIQYTSGSTSRLFWDLSSQDTLNILEAKPGNESKMH